MTTPQRALEVLERCTFPELLKAEADVLIAAINHYAEIMRAEVFAEIDEDGDLSIAGSWCGNVKAVAVNAQLIIKPKPLP